MTKHSIHWPWFRDGPEVPKARLDEFARHCGTKGWGKDESVCRYIPQPIAHMDSSATNPGLWMRPGGSRSCSSCPSGPKRGTGRPWTRGPCGPCCGPGQGGRILRRSMDALLPDPLKIEINCCRIGFCLSVFVEVAMETKEPSSFFASPILAPRPFPWARTNWRHGRHWPRPWPRFSAAITQGFWKHQFHPKNGKELHHQFQ